MPRPELERDREAQVPGSRPGRGHGLAERVGRRHDGWLPYPPAPETYRDGLAAVRRAAARAGRRAGDITPALFVSVVVTDSAERGRELLDTFSRASYGLPLTQLETIQALAAGPPKLRPLLAGA